MKKYFLNISLGDTFVFYDETAEVEGGVEHVERIRTQTGYFGNAVRAQTGVGR